MGLMMGTERKRGCPEESIARFLGAPHQRTILGAQVASYQTHSILYVFLASPGDLVEERHVARSVVDELNHSLSRELGWRIELMGWEDTLPGSRRPQELINKDVESCHLFLGMFWKRWGQPTGSSSS
jgi:hypothetical protein